LPPLECAAEAIDGARIGLAKDGRCT